LPEFVVTSVEPGEVVGSLSATSHAGESWVADGWWGYLVSGTTAVEGRWHARGEAWAFRVEDPEPPAFSPSQVWRVYDGYWGERVALVLGDRSWERTAFEPSDGLRLTFDGNVFMRRALPGEAVEGELVPGAWNHEHCDICWETIGANGQAVGYRSAAEEWVCETCYRGYVEPKSLGFIPHT
jgi:hypothetical protein